MKFPRSSNSAPTIHTNPSFVPDSMEEIYQLSNLNRKRNKQKKKLKGEKYDTNLSSLDDNEYV